MPPFPSPAQDNLRAIVIRCGAVACFALMGGAFKWASEDGAGVFEMLFFRGLVGVPLLLGWRSAGGSVRSTPDGPARIFSAR